MKPSDLHLGISELFSILIPGFLIVVVGLEVFGGIETSNKVINTGILIAIASYIFGHIFFAIGSRWDKVYDLVKPKGNEKLLETIDEIRASSSKYACAEINNYKWSRSILSKQHPDGYKEVLRHEADSKLFRSLIIPLIITSIFLLIQAQLWFRLIAVGMTCIAFMRFRDQRFKGCKLAYTHIIVLTQFEILRY
jgi:hypothetical protein